MNDYNYILDADLLKKTLTNFLKHGTIEIEVRDDGTVIKGIFLARAYPHASSNMLEVTSDCLYGGSHPDLEILNAQTASSHDSRKIHTHGSDGIKIHESILNRDWIPNVEVKGN